MDLTESFRTAVESLQTNKLRAGLTMLGVIIGVAAVIALLSVGNGVNAAVEEQVRAIGSNLITVLTDSEKSGGYPALSLADVNALADPYNAPAVVQVAAMLQGSAQVTFGGREKAAAINGVTANYLDVRNQKLAFGSDFTIADIDNQARVAILGWEVHQKLFPDDEYPIGETVKIRGTSYQVIGVLKSQGAMGFASADDQVYVPITTAQVRLFPRRTRDGARAVGAIMVQAVSEDQMDLASEQIRSILREQHGIAYQADDDFTILSQKEILEVFGVLTGVLTIFLGSIAGISLVVGGIGIMNIMLVSVTERTREIGIRKAVGALRRDILAQFLIESLVLGLSGGALGVVLGATTAAVIDRLSADLTPVLDVGTVAMATGFAAGVGLIFGIYPAWRAASLRPIEALRYE
jgi:putative ABC transport system permease protein